VPMLVCAVTLLQRLAGLSGRAARSAPYPYHFDRSSANTYMESENQKEEESATLIS
jgi:hypothetical protein